MTLFYLNKNEKTWSQVSDYFTEGRHIEGKVEEEEEVTVAFRTVDLICIVGLVGLDGTNGSRLLVQFGLSYCYNFGSNHVSPHLQMFINITT